jgi:hypothetical protein
MDFFDIINKININDTNDMNYVEKIINDMNIKKVNEDSSMVLKILCDKISTSNNICIKNCKQIIDFAKILIYNKDNILDVEKQWFTKLVVSILSNVYYEGSTSVKLFRTIIEEQLITLEYLNECITNLLIIKDKRNIECYTLINTIYDKANITFLQNKSKVKKIMDMCVSCLENMYEFFDFPKMMSLIIYHCSFDNTIDTYWIPRKDNVIYYNQHGYYNFDYVPIADIKQYCYIKNDEMNIIKNHIIKTDEINNIISLGIGIDILFKIGYDSIMKKQDDFPKKSLLLRSLSDRFNYSLFKLLLHEIRNIKWCEELNNELSEFINSILNHIIKYKYCLYKEKNIYYLTKSEQKEQFIKAITLIDYKSIWLQIHEQILKIFRNIPINISTLLFDNYEILSEHYKLHVAYLMNEYINSFNIDISKLITNYL